MSSVHFNLVIYHHVCFFWSLKKNNSADCLISNRQMSQGLPNGETVSQGPTSKGVEKNDKRGYFNNKINFIWNKYLCQISILLNCKSNLFSFFKLEHYAFWQTLFAPSIIQHVNDLCPRNFACVLASTRRDSKPNQTNPIQSAWQMRSYACGQTSVSPKREWSPTKSAPRTLGPPN